MSAIYCGRLNTFLELKIENERLHQRLRDAKAREAELDRLEAKNQGLPAFTLTQPPPYAGSSSGAGGVHARANTAPSTQSFAWTLGSAAAGSSRSFDGRPAYAGLADVSAVGAAGGGIDSPGGSGTPGEPTDPSADHTVPRKKVSPDPRAPPSRPRADAPRRMSRRARRRSRRRCIAA